MIEKTQPQRGQVWRERRTAYKKRTVLIESVNQGFVYTQTMTGLNGLKPSRPVHNRVRLNLWHSSWTWEPKAGDFL